MAPERLLQGIVVDADTIAEELIARSRRTAYFLNEEHTARYFREELFCPIWWICGRRWRGSTIR